MGIKSWFKSRNGQAFLDGVASLFSPPRRRPTLTPEESIARAVQDIADAVQECIDNGWIDENGLTDKGREHDEFLKRKYKR